MSREAIKAYALEDFPESLVPEGDREVIRWYDDRDFGVLGVDGEQRLVSASDDGWIIGYHLDEATIEQRKGRVGRPLGKRLKTQQDDIAARQFPEEFMFERDVSEWVWVHPRYRWLVEGLDGD